MAVRSLATALALVSLTCTACGWGSRSSNADLANIPQPTPDPTLDAVVRDLPRMLSGVAAPTQTATPVFVTGPASKPRAGTVVPVAPTTSRSATATPTKPRR